MANISAEYWHYAGNHPSISHKAVRLPLGLPLSVVVYAAYCSATNMWLNPAKFEGKVSVTQVHPNNFGFRVLVVADSNVWVSIYSEYNQFITIHNLELLGFISPEVG